jgi:hypothetical protein
MLAILSVAAVSCTILAVNQTINYRPWLTHEELVKLEWIADNSQNGSMIFIIYSDFGEDTWLWAEMRRNWVQAIAGTQTQVYFGEVYFLMHSEPTPSSSFHVNYTSYEFWDQMEDVSSVNSENFLILEWYEADIDPRYTRQLSLAGVFLSEVR